MSSHVKPKPKVLNINGITPFQQMASSFSGALLVSMFMTPLDVVKIRLQAQDRALSKKCFLYSNGIMDHVLWKTNGESPVALHTAKEICNCKWYNRPKYFNGTLDAFVKIGKLEGVSSLWSGLSPTLVLAAPTTVIYFTMYEQLKAKIVKSSSNPEKYATVISLSSGGLARMVAVGIVSPLELVRTKMQAQKMAFSEVKSAVAITFKAEGLTGLWKGVGATMLRDVPFSAVYWPCYEYLRPKEPHSDDMSHFSHIFLASLVSGGFAGTVTMPADVIKTRLQLELGETGIRMTSRHVIKEIISNQGYRGFYNGLVPRILKVSPACAIMMSSYEFCKHYFHMLNLRAS
jgi:solute carrier family 25 protein 39/40